MKQLINSIYEDVSDESVYWSTTESVVIESRTIITCSLSENTAVEIIDWLITVWFESYNNISCLVQVSVSLCWSTFVSVIVMLYMLPTL